MSEWPRVISLIRDAPVSFFLEFDEPPLTGRDTITWVDIYKNVVTAVASLPIAQPYGLIVIIARMANKKRKTETYPRPKCVGFKD